MNTNDGWPPPQAGTVAAYSGVFRDGPGLGLDEAEVCDQLAIVAYDRGRLNEALRLAERAVELAPAAAQYRVKVGALLLASGRPGDALVHLAEGLRRKGNLPELHNNLGIALRELGWMEEGIAAFRTAASLRTDYFDALFNLAGALRKAERIAEAIAAYERAVALRPSFAAALAALSDVNSEHGRQDEAIACRRRLAYLEPKNPIAHSDLLYTLHYSPRVTPRQRLEQAREWARQHGAVTHCLPPLAVDRDPDRQLRVGYLSPDFRAHTLSHMIQPVLEFHDRSYAEAYCYSAVRRPDDVTQRLRPLADVWRDVATLNDDAAARLIRDDRIDILVELAGHMGDNRLLVLARRPAPVQVQIYYAGTTGLPQTDYRIADVYSDPPGAEEFYTEKLVRLPDVAWPYDPSDGSPPVGPPPLTTAGHVTFGCLNKPVKVTAEALDVWCRILSAVPGSRLLLLGHADNRGWQDRLVRHGLDPGRLELVPRCSRHEYLELFNRIDISLDPFPYNGDTTTCDGLWMGVPVVTLAGDVFVSRRGVSHLNAVGLAELVANTPEEYVSIAVKLARDSDRLRDLRSTLRGRMQLSPLLNGRRYTANLEDAYRTMWRRWAAGIRE